MKWKINKYKCGWKRKFAILPVCSNDECVWMKKYWVKLLGLNGYCDDLLDFGKDCPHDRAFSGCEYHNK